MKVLHCLSKKKERTISQLVIMRPFGLKKIIIMKT